MPENPDRSRVTARRAATRYLPVVAVIAVIAIVVAVIGTGGGGGGNHPAPAPRGGLPSPLTRPAPVA